MKRYAANIITLIRIPLSLFLLLPMNTYVFLGLYALCGLSDLLDGIVARKTNAQSTFGARLDSIADLFMMGMIVFKLFQSGLIGQFLPWIIGISAVRVVSMLVVYLKHQLFGMLHTWANKAAGLLVFFALPLTYLMSNMIVGWVVVIIGLYAAIEELFINMRDKNFYPDKKHWFEKQE